MSYLTDYEMKPNIRSCGGVDPWKKCDIINAFIESTRVDGWSYLNDVWIGDGEDLTWYDHKIDMSRLSIAFPNTLFILWGRGEESDDLWKEYYLGGKCQAVKGEIVYPAFDESELKSLNKECPSCYGEGVLHADGYPSIGCPKCNGEGEVFDG